MSAFHHVAISTLQRICMGLMVGLLLCLGTSCKKKEAAREEDRVLKLAMDLWPGYYPALLADELGYFAREDIEVTIDLPQDTQRMKSDFIAQRYDGIFISFGDVILMTRNDPRIRFVLVANESRGADQILGDEIFREPSELRGKTVSTALGGFGELFVRRFLASRGMQPDDVIVANADAADVPRLLRTRTVAAGHTWEPYARTCREEGASVLFSSDEAPGLIMDGLVAQLNSLNRKPETYRAFARAWFAALTWWKENPGEGNEILERRLRKVPQGGGLVSLQGIESKDLESNRRLLGATAEPALGSTLGEYVDFFLSKGTLGQPLTTKQIIDARLVQ